MDMAAKGAYQLLQHYVCRDYKTSQRGNGMGGVHHRHNAHRLYLIPKMDEIEHVKPNEKHVKPDDDRSSKCDKVTIKMISPAQATLERAESEIRRRKKEEKELHPKTKRQKIARKTIKPIPGLPYNVK